MQLVELRPKPPNGPPERSPCSCHRIQLMLSLKDKPSCNHKSPWIYPVDSTSSWRKFVRIPDESGQKRDSGMAIVSDGTVRSQADQGAISLQRALDALRDDLSGEAKPIESQSDVFILLGCPWLTHLAKGWMRPPAPR